MNRILRLRDGSTLDVLGLVALGVLLGALVLAASLVIPLVSLYRDPPQPATARPNAEENLGDFRSSTEREVALIESKHLFYPPAAVVTKPPEPQHLTYYGPALMGYVNGTAWFANGEKVSAANPVSESFKFIRANPPWSVVVQYQTKEYEVPLFSKTDMSKLRETVTIPSKYVPPAPSASGSALKLGASPTDGTLGPGAVQPGASGPQPATAAVVPAGGPAPQGGPPPQGSGPPPPPPPSDPRSGAPGGAGPSPQPEPPSAVPGGPAPASPPSNPSQGPSEPPREPPGGSEPSRPSPP